MVGNTRGTDLIRRCTLGVLAALLTGACDPGPAPVASPPPAGPFVTGTPVLEVNGWIEYVPGDAPLIIIAPHGGRLTPFRLGKRKCEECLGGIDSHTTELARLVADSFATRTGHRPHLVLNLLHRSKLDANRDMLEATAGNHVLEPTWNWLHASIDSAKAAAIRQAGRGLVIDLHAHAQKIDRVGGLFSITIDPMRHLHGGRAGVSPPRVRFLSGTGAQAHRSGRRSSSCPLQLRQSGLASHPFACRYATLRTYISR
jgi:hypothetical protein